MTGSAANTIGTLNSIRYRGYFYDNDLGFYLLETRYYDPETGRFINADGVVDNRGAQTTNLYAYCANNPINNKDEDGGTLQTILVAAGVGGLIGGAIKGYKAYKKYKGTKHAVRKVAKAFGKGFLKGALEGALCAIPGARALKTAKAMVNIGKARRLYVATNTIFNGVYASTKHYAKRMKPTVSKYIKQVNTAIKYVPKKNRSSSSYGEIKAATANLCKAASPTKGDVAAGALAASVGLLGSKMSASAEGLEEVETLLSENLMSSVGAEAYSQIGGKMMEQTVVEMFPGEAA